MISPGAINVSIIFYLMIHLLTEYLYVIVKIMDLRLTNGENGGGLVGIAQSITKIRREGQGGTCKMKVIAGLLIGSIL